MCSSILYGVLKTRELTHKFISKVLRKDKIISSFLIPSVKYVRHIILAEGLIPREKRIQATLEAPAPSLSTLQIFRFGFQS